MESVREETWFYKREGLCSTTSSSIDKKVIVSNYISFEKLSSHPQPCLL